MAILSRVLHHEKRLLPLHLPGLSPQTSNSGSAAPSVSLTLKLESPPIILYGQPTDSTGSIVSGLLFLDVTAGSHTHATSSSTSSSPSLGSSSVLSPVPSRSSLNRNHTGNTSNTLLNNFLPVVPQPSPLPPPFMAMDLETVTLSLVQTIKYTKPFLPPSSSITGCKNCATSKNVLARWDVLTSKTSLQLGTHGYPFSHLLPGSLPASCKLGSYHSQSFIKYDLIAEAKVPGQLAPVALVEVPINISRLILRGPDRNSLRVFPPTEVTASAVLPNVVYPKSSFPIELKLDNVVSERGDRRWRMRKLSWRIEEQIKVQAHSCLKHEPKLIAMEEQHKRSNLHKELRSGASPSATGSGDNKPSGSGSNNTNVHHSTIQTNSTLSSSPSAQLQNQIQLQELQRRLGLATRSGGDIDDEPVADVPQTSAPEDSHRSFMEDFVHPTQPTTATEPVDHTDPSQESTPTASTTSTSNTSTAAAAADGPVIDAKLQEQHLYLEETRTVNHGEIKSGWKSDFSGRGKIELVADISAMHLSSGLVRNITKKSSYESLPKDDGLRNGANISCDIDDPQLGVFVQHTLIVELVIAEELLQNEHKRSMNGIRPSISNNGLRPVTSTNSVLSNDSSTGIHPIASNSTTNSHSHTPHTLGTPSGAARVLRMQFKLPFTERSGLGIAWDDEVPPTYEDIRALSPPTYADSSLEGTPIFGGLTEGSNSNLGTPRRVLYGVGNTPATGPFGLEANMGSGIDNMVDLDERIQEFTL